MERALLCLLIISEQLVVPIVNVISVTIKSAATEKEASLKEKKFFDYCLVSSLLSVRAKPG